MINYKQKEEEERERENNKQSVIKHIMSSLSKKDIPTTLFVLTTIISMMLLLANNFHLLLDQNNNTMEHKNDERKLLGKNRWAQERQARALQILEDLVPYMQVYPDVNHLDKFLTIFEQHLQNEMRIELLNQYFKLLRTHRHDGLETRLFDAIQNQINAISPTQKNKDPFHMDERWRSLQQPTHNIPRPPPPPATSIPLNLHQRGIIENLNKSNPPFQWQINPHPDQRPGFEFAAYDHPDYNQALNALTANQDGKEVQYWIRASQYNQYRRNTGPYSYPPHPQPQPQPPQHSYPPQAHQPQQMYASQPSPSTQGIELLLPLRVPPSLSQSPSLEVPAAQELARAISPSPQPLHPQPAAPLMPQDAAPHQTMHVIQQESSAQPAPQPAIVPIPNDTLLQAYVQQLQMNSAVIVPAGAGE